MISQNTFFDFKFQRIVIFFWTRSENMILLILRVGGCVGFSGLPLSYGLQQPDFVPTTALI